MIFSALILNVFLLSETIAALPRAARPNIHSPMQQVRHMDQRITRSKNQIIGRYGPDGPLRRSRHILQINKPNDNIPENIISKKLSRELPRIVKMLGQYQNGIGRTNDRSDSNSVSEDDSYDRNGKEKVLILRKGNDRSDSNAVSDDDSYDRNGKELDNLINVLRSKVNENDRSDSNSVSEDDSYDRSPNDRNRKELMQGELDTLFNVLRSKVNGNDRSDSNPVSEDDSYDSSQNDRNGKVLSQEELDKLINVLRSKVNENDRSDSNPVSEDDSYDSSLNDRRGTDKAALRQGHHPLSLLMMRQAVGKKINANLTPKQMTGQELSTEELDVDPNKYDSNGMMYLSRPDEKNEERELNVRMNNVATGQRADMVRQPRKPKREKREKKDPLEREIRPKYDENGMMYLSEPDGNNTERTLSVLLNKVVKYHEEGKKSLRGTSLVEIFDPAEIRLMEDAVYTQTVEETGNSHKHNQNGRRFNLYKQTKGVPHDKNKFLGDLFNFNATLNNVTLAANKTAGNSKPLGGNLSTLTVTVKPSTVNSTTLAPPRSTSRNQKAIFNFSSSLGEMTQRKTEDTTTPLKLKIKSLKLNFTTPGSSTFVQQKEIPRFRSLGDITRGKKKEKKKYISPHLIDIYDLLL